MSTLENLKVRIKTFAEHARPYLKKAWEITCIAAKQCATWSKIAYQKAKPHVIAGYEKLRTWFLGLPSRTQIIVGITRAVLIISLFGLTVARMSGNGNQGYNALQASAVVTAGAEKEEAVVKEDFQYLRHVYCVTAGWGIDMWFFDVKRGNFEIWQNVADKGIPEGQILIGLCHSYGINVPADQDKAINWFRKAAQKSADGQYCLSLYYHSGWGVSEDITESKKWFLKAAEQYHKAAEQGNAEAQLMFALPFESFGTSEFPGSYFDHGIMDKADMTKASKWLQKAAEQGNVSAQFLLGSLYYIEGMRNKAQDKAEGMKWLRKAAEEDPCVQMLISDVYKIGLFDVSSDVSESVKWLRRAADKGFAQAQYDLGTRYFEGDGVPEDHAEAIKWYRKVAEQGKIREYMLGICYCKLGDCYYDGDGVPENKEEAVKWLRKAAEQGSADGQCHLGLCYLNGEGVLENTEEAVKWFCKAAEQGHAEAQYSLGVCYNNGDGVPKDKAEAVKWLRKAAEQGLSSAQYALGDCYFSGSGIAEDILPLVNNLHFSCSIPCDTIPLFLEFH